MLLPWAPIIWVDILGSAGTLVAALGCLWLSWQWTRQKADDDFRHYVFLLTSAIGIFAVSRSFGHLVKQYLLFVDLPDVWQRISPYSGASNTAIFIIIFAFSIYFHRLRKVHLQVEEYRHHLEYLVRERTSELQHQLRFEQELVDSIPAPIFFKDTDGYYLGCNAAFEKLSGFSSEKLMGKNIFDFVPADIAEPHHAVDLELLKKSGIKTYEGILPNSAGEPREVICYKSTFRDRDGNVGGLIGTIFDITERKILERQLQQKQKMEAIGTLAGGIAHDFNNILMAIMGYTDLAISRLPAENAVSGHLEAVKQASQRAKDLVKQILFFSRMEEQQTSPIAIGTIIKEVCKLIRATLPSTIDIEYNIRPGNGLVMANATQIHQIVMNLASNAGHAMRDKGGVLGIHLAEVAGEEITSAVEPLNAERYQKLVISDTGCGMEKAVLERLFDPFFTTKEIGEGTGLGLSVVHGIVKKIGGVLDVQSTPGKGTVFTVYFPVFTDRQAEKREGEAALLCGSEHILFVDDEKIIADMIREILESLGYTVDSCTDSLEALKVFRKNPYKFDLIISDQTMPHMTGMELAEKIFEFRPDVPIILCTGFSETVSPELAAEKGIRKFVMKPIVGKEFAGIIRKVLDEAKQ